jgi:type I restriction enzyme R subunit
MPELVTADDLRRLRGLDAADLAGMVHDLREEIRKPPQLRDQIWDLYKPVKNKGTRKTWSSLNSSSPMRRSGRSFTKD